MSRDDWALPLPMKPVSTFISRRKQKLRKHLDIRCGRWLETTAQSVVGDTWEIPKTLYAFGLKINYDRWERW